MSQTLSKRQRNRIFRAFGESRARVNRAALCRAEASAPAPAAAQDHGAARRGGGGRRGRARGAARAARLHEPRGHRGGEPRARHGRAPRREAIPGTPRTRASHSQTNFTYAPANTPVSRLLRSRQTSFASSTPTDLLVRAHTHGHQWDNVTIGTNGTI